MSDTIDPDAVKTRGELDFETAQIDERGWEHVEGTLWRRANGDVYDLGLAKVDSGRSSTQVVDVTDEHPEPKSLAEWGEEQRLESGMRQDRIEQERGLPDSLGDCQTPEEKEKWILKNARNPQERKELHAMVFDDAYAGKGTPEKWSWRYTDEGQRQRRIRRNAELSRKISEMADEDLDLDDASKERLEEIRDGAHAYFSGEDVDLTPREEKLAREFAEMQTREVVNVVAEAEAEQAQTEQMAESESEHNMADHNDGTGVEQDGEQREVIVAEEPHWPMEDVGEMGVVGTRKEVEDGLDERMTVSEVDGVEVRAVGDDRAEIAYDPEQINEEQLIETLNPTDRVPNASITRSGQDEELAHNPTYEDLGPEQTAEIESEIDEGRARQEAEAENEIREETEEEKDLETILYEEYPGEGSKPEQEQTLEQEQDQDQEQEEGLSY
jgi:hypothetical protein